jgi:hypothetical protein
VNERERGANREELGAGMEEWKIGSLEDWKELEGRGRVSDLEKRYSVAL